VSRWGARRHRGLYWVSVLVAIFMVAGGISYGYAGYRNTAGAQGAVRGYLEAVARGDAADALAYGSIPSGSRSYLTADVLRQQLQAAPMRDILVVSSTPAAGGQLVTFSYDLAFAGGAVRVSDSVGVHRTGGHWRLDRVAASPLFEGTQATNRMTLAGVKMPQTGVLLFPGAVPVHFDTPYLRLSLDTEQLTLSDSGATPLKVELTAPATALVKHDLADLLDACGAGRAGSLSDSSRCPVPDDEAVPGSLQGTFHDEADDLALVVDDNPSGSVSISGAARFEGKYRSLDFDDVPQSRTGKLTVLFTAAGYAVSPLHLRFTVPA
jgi:hypothetical protein